MYLRLFCCGCLIIGFLSSSTKPGLSSAQQAAGEYTFKYQTGEIESLILRDDKTFMQEFYKDVESYRMRSQPTYTNESTWTYTKNSLKMKIWLSFCEFPDPRERIDPPLPSASMPGRWEAPTAKSPAAIVLSDDFYYVLVRVTN